VSVTSEDSKMDTRGRGLTVRTAVEKEEGTDFCWCCTCCIYFMSGVVCVVVCVSVVL
jgi:hypothetical protein